MSGISAWASPIVGSIEWNSTATWIVGMPSVPQRLLSTRSAALLSLHKAKCFCLQILGCSCKLRSFSHLYILSDGFATDQILGF